MKKPIKILVFLTPIIMLGSTLSVITAISMKKKDNNTNGSKIQIDSKNGNKDIFENIKIFPDLSPDHFYPYIRMKEASVDPIINEDMIAYIVKYIFKHMSITKGKCFWGYKKISDSQILITIKWVHSYLNKDYTYKKSYIFNASNLV